MWKDDDPLIGQVHREKKSRTQHYLLSAINGIKYKLTGKFVVYRGEVHAELINEKGNTLWSNKDGDWIEYFDMKGQALHPWEEEINWNREPLSRVTKFASSEELEEAVIEKLSDVTMVQLACIASIVFACEISFAEADGPGGVISDIAVHWDKPPANISFNDTPVHDSEVVDEHRKFKLALQEIAAMSGGVSRHNNMKSFPVVKHLVKRMGNTAAEAIGHKPVFEDIE